MISKFFVYTKNEDNLYSTIYLLRLFCISILVEPNQMKLGFVITNDKASYIAKEDSICLFSVAKETPLNKVNKTLCPFEKRLEQLRPLCQLNPCI